MTSLSLPRVLHSKKNSLMIERENFERAQTQTLSKAINHQETAVKQKHVRSAIIGTFHLQEATTFWAIVLRLPIMDDRIVAWKFCHVVHKILREGHPLCLVHSQKHIRDLDEIGKLWVHLKDGYGKMIRLYTSLLMTKLDFHRKNPRFPGHLGVTPDELESIAANDINNYFQMSVEMFDYLDNIIDLQAAVFGSLDMARSNSMTSAGQCRLAPLIPCIQDASKLYDYCVKIMFRLHSTLSSDILSGHRQRFLKQFKFLKLFYQNTSNLQYFKDLIAIPPLPENPPNFLLQSDFGVYVTQEVVVPEEVVEEEHMEGNLIDTSDDGQSNISIPAGPSIDDLIVERDFLRGQCEKLNSDFNSVRSKSQKLLEECHNKIISLETDLVTKESELTQERQIKEELMNQAFSLGQTQDSEQKAKDEKFTKLKTFYVKLRDDHIIILRENAEKEKKLAQSLKILSVAQNEKTELETTIENLRSNITEIEGNLMKSRGEDLEKLESLKKDKELFNMEIEIMKKSINDVSFERDNMKTDLVRVEELNRDLKVEIADLLSIKTNLEQEIRLTEKTFNDKIKNLLHAANENNKSILLNTIETIDDPALSALTCSPDYLMRTSNDCLNLLKCDNDLLKKDDIYLLRTTTKLTHFVAIFILLGRATANKSCDVNYGEKITNECKVFGELVIKLLEIAQNRLDSKPQCEEVIEKMNEICALFEGAAFMGINAGNVADMLENEMSQMDKVISEAASRIQDMLTKSRNVHSGIKLEVHSKILDSCTKLMAAIQILVAKSKLLQTEIIAQGKGSAGVKEFYKRNHQWTDGFISAAKAVAAAAQFLVVAADKVVSSDGKLEQLVVAAQEIAASTAQLVVASKVKADRHSNNLQQLTQASKGVNLATGTIVGTVKDCGQMIEEADVFDPTNLTLHQAKQFEMESQVRVLELEKDLELERRKLLQLRKHHYKLEENET